MARARRTSSPASREAITIIGIPLALANWKMVPISLFPLGKQIVPSDRMMAAYGQ